MPETTRTPESLPTPESLATSTASPASALPPTPSLASNLPPGPKLPYWLQTLLVWDHTESFLKWCRRRYGPTFTVRAFPSKVAVYVTEPEDIKATFAADPDVLRAGEANAILGPVLGQRSVLLADGQEHLERRRLMLPFFHGESVQRYGEVVGAIVDAEVARWPMDEPFALHERMQAITLEVILRAVIGVEESQRLTVVRTALRRIVELDAGVLYMWVFPWLGRVGRWRRLRRWQAEAEALLMDEIASRRRAPDLAQRTDVLSLLISAEREDGTGMDDEELRAQLLTMLLAGHETTATGLAWSFERLVRNPQAMAAAVRAANGEDDEYLDAVVKETLRVRPVIPDVARYAAQPFELNGRLIPAGVTIMPAIALVHWGEAYPDAAAFRPERWLGDAQQPPALAWIPFGGGRRRCLGAAFATFEMRTALRHVLRAVSLQPVERCDEPIKPAHITLVPKHGARVIAVPSVPGSIATR
jgi:cytochrome P450